MKPRHKPRPLFIYREENKNPLGEWVCSRMTYDQEQYELWRSEYLKFIEGGRPSWYSERRYALGAVHWMEDPR
jgi:hypothetical protein